MIARTYKVFTLGCKLNQFDTASIEGLLRARGFRSAPETGHAGVVVINTCTVTEKADREALRLTRSARRKNPDCRLIVTGCFAQRDAPAILAMGGVDAVIGNFERDRIASVLDAISQAAEPELQAAAWQGEQIACIEEAGGGAAAGDRIAPAESAGGKPVLHFGEKTRAFLKVQEGCDLNCSYCIIPQVRGRSRSITPDAVLTSLEELVARGYREIVLTGVNTGDYGKDLTPKTTLASLLSRLLEVPGLGRLRLNSLEPRTVTPSIVELLKNDSRLARHLQVPLQSGCDRILKVMYRNYTTADYLRVIESLRREIPQIGIGADVIVGFPGETEAEFERTCRFIESSALNYLHVFSYSDRPGTPASGLDRHVAQDRVSERSARLRAMGRDLGLAFRRSWLGSTLPTLVLYERRADGLRRALTDNFIDMGLDPESCRPNSIVAARITGVAVDDTIGAVCASG